jgi:hypothetical protein
MTFMPCVFKFVKSLFLSLYRQNRKWMYDSIEVEGREEVIRNKLV